MFGFAELHIHYIVWHYSRGFADAFIVWRNMLWFVLRMFPVGALMRHWFARFKQFGEEKQSSGFDPGEFFSRLLVNAVMRVIGFLLRTLLILVGLVLLVAVFAVGSAFLIFWLLYPALVMILFGTGVYLFAT